MSWSNVSDSGSRFITLAKKESFFHLVLEEVSKNWSHPFNWRLTCSDDTAHVLWQETFYLDVECNTPATAQVRADSLFTKHLEVR